MAKAKAANSNKTSFGLFSRKEFLGINLPVSINSFKSFIFCFY